VDALSSIRTKVNQPLGEESHIRQIVAVATRGEKPDVYARSTGKPDVRVDTFKEKKTTDSYNADRPAGDRVPIRNDDGTPRGHCEFNRGGGEERCDFKGDTGHDKTDKAADRAFVVDKNSGDQKVSDSDGHSISGKQGKMP
jgi:hypothetical protein